MTRVPAAEDLDTRRAHEVTARAVRRLDVLEWVILLLAALLAVTGGWVVALVLSTSIGFPFRTTWITASVLLLGVPVGVKMVRMRSEKRDGT